VILVVLFGLSHSRPLCWQKTQPDCACRGPALAPYNPGKLLHCHLVGSAPPRSKVDLVLKCFTLHTYLLSSNQHLMHFLTNIATCSGALQHHPLGV